MDKKDTGFWSGLLAGIKDSIEPKIKPGDSIPGMSGGRASQLLNGGTCVSPSESKMLATYVEKMTQVGDPRRAQYSYAANEQRRVGASPMGLLLIIVVLILGILAYIKYGSSQLSLETGDTLNEKYLNSQKSLFDTIEHIRLNPMGRVVITSEFRVNTKRTELEYLDKRYPITDMDSQEVLWEVTKNNKINHPVILLFANYELRVFDESSVETDIHLYEKRRDGYYIYDSKTNKALKAYVTKDLRDGAFADYALCIAGTNLIIKFQ